MDPHTKELILDLARKGLDPSQITAQISPQEINALNFSKFRIFTDAFTEGYHAGQAAALAELTTPIDKIDPSPKNSGVS